jgi:hypothetical protein
MQASTAGETFSAYCCIHYKPTPLAVQQALKTYVEGTTQNLNTMF